MNCNQAANLARSIIRRRGTVLAASISVAASAPVVLAQPTITNLGVLDGETAAYANAVVGDDPLSRGAAGASSLAPASGRAFLWTTEEGLQDLGTLPGGTYATACGLSWDRTVIAGTSGIPGGRSHAFRWTAAGMQDLGVLPASESSYARGISLNGSVIVGRCDIPGAGGRAFRWTSTGGMRDLGLLPGGVDAEATAVNAFGDAIVGTCLVADAGSRAFYWNSTIGSRPLEIPPEVSESFAAGLDDSGRAVAGSVHLTSGGFHACFWRAGRPFSDLGVPPGQTSSFGCAVSSANYDLPVVVGYSHSAANGQRAFYWSGPTGMQDMAEFLTSKGFDLTGWTLTAATDVQSAGTVICGYGLLNDEPRAWIVTGLYPPCDPDVNQDGNVDTNDVDYLINSIASDNPNGIDPDFNHDGNVDQGDVDAILNVIAGGNCP